MGASLLSDPLFQRFAAQRPIATMVQMTLSHLLDEDAVNQVFADHAEQQYERTLLFSTLTDLVGSVVLGKNASVNAAYRKMQHKLGVSITATYGKLVRVEPAISQALVRYSFERVQLVGKELNGLPRHDIAGYETRTLDGNHLAGTEHRLLETRDITAAPLPGKSLVVYSPRHDAVADFFPIEDGHANERSALDDVLETVKRRQLWLADRNFSTVKFMDGLIAAGATFIIRQHQKVGGKASGRLRKIGKTETGTAYEQFFDLPEQDGVSIRVRRVVVRLTEATRDGDVELAILTNVPADDADAIKIAEVYRTRWKIETMFQHLTETMNCEIKPLCYPKAALFCFANALVAYNALAVVKAVITHEHGRERTDSLSHYYLALEISEATDGLLIAVPEDNWVEFGRMSCESFAIELAKVAAAVEVKRYAKSTRGPKTPKPKKKHAKRVVHVSTKKLLDQRRKSQC